MGSVLQRLVVWFAFAGAFLVPALARAALIPTCDARDQLSRMRVEVDPPSDDACSLAAHTADDDEIGDPRAAAMCDPRGASILAPQRILPITDARIEAAASSCADDGSSPAIGPGPDHPPISSPSVALAEHAVLDPALMIPPPEWELAPAFLPIPGGTRTGFAQGIDHPPR